MEDQIVLDMLRIKLERDLLKYSAGQSITCPRCGTIADWRSWVIAERVADGKIMGQCCAQCFDTAQGDKPLPDGYRVIRHGKPKRQAKAKPATMPKPGKALDAWLRKATLAEHKRLGNCTKTDRVFPGIVHSSSRPLYHNDDGDWSNGQITADYVAKYCRLNHLKVV